MITSCLFGSCNYKTIQPNVTYSAYSQSINKYANFRFLQRLSAISGFCHDCPRSLASSRDHRLRKMAFCRDCPCDSASCRDSKSHGQSLQEAIYQAQHPWQEARDRRQSPRKPNMTDSLCRKRKLADSFIPCVTAGHTKYFSRPLKLKQELRKPGNIWPFTISSHEKPREG